MRRYFFPFSGFLVLLAILIAIPVLTSQRQNSRQYAQTTPQTPIPATYFGMHVLNFSGVSLPLSVGSLRTWDVYPQLQWVDQNPSSGTYNWTNLDAFITYAQSKGADIIYTFGRTPQWASSQPNATTNYGPGQCAPPTNMQDWKNFVQAIATHVADKIKYWEIWNEPQDPSFYCGDIPTMVEMAKEAYTTIKATDPSAMIVSPATTGGMPGGPGPKWFDSFLAQGGGNYIDIIAFHGYATTTPEDINTVINDYKTVISAHGQSNKPMWDTESSWAGNGQGPTDQNIRADYVARSYLLHWSDGISRFYWYGYDTGQWGALQGGLDEKAYQQVYTLLVGATLTQPCTPNGTVWTCTITRPNNYEAIAVWDTQGSSTFSVPSGYTQYSDISGNTTQLNGSATVSIGPGPIFLENLNAPTNPSSPSASAPTALPPTQPPNFVPSPACLGPCAPSLVPSTSLPVTITAAVSQIPAGVPSITMPCHMANQTNQTVPPHAQYRRRGGIKNNGNGTVLQLLQQLIALLSQLLGGSLPAGQTPAPSTAPSPTQASALPTVSFPPTGGAGLPTTQAPTNTPPCSSPTP